MKFPSKSNANGAEALSRTVAAANRVTVSAHAALLIVDPPIAALAAHRDMCAYFNRLLRGSERLIASFDQSFDDLGFLSDKIRQMLYGSNVPVLIGFGALALVLVALTRGRLDYQKYRQVVEPDPATA
jgi:hypothetical protein